MAKVIVIGGGISGMTAAFRLQRDHGLEVTVLESDSRSGGKAQTYVIDGFTCEEATNSWIDREPSVRDLLKDLDIYDRLKPSDESAERRFIYREGGLHEMHMHPLKFMMSSVLPLGARLRLALEPFIRKGPGDIDETLADFAARRLGKGARDILIGPMATGVYAGDPSHMSLRSCFAKVHNLEQNYGGLIKGMMALKKASKEAGEDPSTVQAGPSGKLTSLEGGLGELTGTLARTLGANLKTGCEATSVSAKRDGGFTVEIEGQGSLEADAVVSAAPAWASALYIKTLDEDAANAFGEIPHPAMDVVCLGYRKEQVPHDLNGFGFVVPRKQGKTLLGSLWTSSIFPGRAPNGHVLIRTLMGGMLEPQVGGWSKKQVLDTVRLELEDILGLPRTEEPTIVRVFRHERAIPQYHVGYSKLVERIHRAENLHPGFFAGGNSIGGVGVMDCVRNSSPLAKRVAEFLGARRGKAIYARL